jgi:Holliday junction resolvase RusA-like endonuclease
VIHIVIDGIPPSTNHAYFTKGARRILTTKGRAYLLETKTKILREFPKVLSFFVKNKPYLVYFRFHLPQIYNAGYPTKTDSRYKTIDVSNRVKLLEDALKDVAAIDDAQNICVVTHKCPGDQEKTEIFIWSVEDEETPLDGLFRL